jgi:hypothetical protein
MVFEGKHALPEAGAYGPAFAFLGDCTAWGGRRCIPDFFHSAGCFFAYDGIFTFHCGIEWLHCRRAQPDQCFKGLGSKEGVSRFQGGYERIYRARISDISQSVSRPKTQDSVIVFHGGNQIFHRRGIFNAPQRARRFSSGFPVRALQRGSQRLDGGLADFDQRVDGLHPEERAFAFQGCYERIYRVRIPEFPQ